MFHCAAAADMNINRDYIRLGWTDLHKSSAYAAISSGNLLSVDTVPRASPVLGAKRARCGGDRGITESGIAGIVIHVMLRLLLVLPIILVLSHERRTAPITQL